jgi:hypothetical protein
MQEKLAKGNYHQEKERIERREFKLLLALIHKLKTAAASTRANMKWIAQAWYWLYPKSPMFVDSTVFEYYHRTVERKQHWSERTDLKLQQKMPYSPCQ